LASTGEIELRKDAAPAAAAGEPLPVFGLSILYGLTIAAAVADAIMVRLGGFSVVTGPLYQDLGFALLFILVAVFYVKTGRSFSIATLLLVTAALIASGPVGRVLDFVTKTMGYPLADATLSEWDHRLGLDWVGYEAWLGHHPLLSSVMGFLYSGTTLWLLAAIAALGWIGSLRQMVRLAIAAQVAAIVCITLGGFLPAIGPHHFYGIADEGKAFFAPMIEQVVTQRPRQIVLLNVEPLTTFPSFHTALGVLMSLGAWRVRRFGPIFAAVNLLWMLGVPVWGSHYFCDMLAGVVIAVAIYAATAKLDAPRCQPQA
jgi:hypothetical protein